MRGTTLIWIYRPVIHVALRFKAATILIAVVILAGSLWPAMRLGTEFMPNLNEGTLFYMLCVPKIRFDVDAGNGRGKLAA